MKPCRMKLAALSMMVLAAAASARADRPNIVLMIGDDMTYTDSGCYGSDTVKTPHMDALAAAGMQFNRAFTATAMCAPTRQQLYTGIFPVRNGAYPNHSHVYDGTESIVHRLRELGYRVGLAGKSHCKPPESYPWETVGGKFSDDFDAIDAFIRRDADEPFCLIVASNEPHTPWNRGDASAYPPERIQVPPYLVDTPETRTGLSKYYAEITYLDRQLGRCLALLDDAGRTDDTLFIFTSEQGSSFPFGGKWTCYENGLHTMLLVRWPGRIATGAKTDAMVQYVDVLPTLIEAAGGEVPAGLDGRSFLAVLDGKAAAHRDYVYGAHTTRGIINGSECYPIRSVRDERYKLIRNLNHRAAFENVLTGRDKSMLSSWHRAGADDPNVAARARFYQHRPATELYDLATDPIELNNRADDPKLAEVKERLQKELTAWMQQQCDKGNETEMKAKERQGQRRKPSKPKPPRGRKPRDPKSSPPDPSPPVRAGQ